MQATKWSLNPEIPSSHKFLAKNQSQPSFPFLCCSTKALPQHFSSNPIKHKSASKKISMKNINKKQTLPSSKSAALIPESKYTRNNRSQQSQNVPKGHSYTPSGISFFSQTQKNPIKLTKSQRRINFSYKGQKKEEERTINNYQPTNYIVDKYIVQPQQINIIFTKNEPQPPKVQKSFEDIDRIFDLSQSFIQEDENINDFDSNKIAGQTSPTFKTIDQGFKFNPPQKHETPPNSCHYSFGKNQKQKFISKYMQQAFRQVESKRQSQNQKDKPLTPSQKHKLFQRYDQQHIIIKKMSFLNDVQQNVSNIHPSQDESSLESQAIFSANRR